MIEKKASLEDLHLLLVLSQTKSFTQAASRLRVSKASVSARIAELERACGVPLVRRTTRSVALTDAGNRFVTETQSAFERIAHSFSRIQDLANSPRGLIRMTAPVALGRQRLAPLMPHFLQRYPDIHVELDLSDRLTRLAQEGFDLAIRHTGAAPDTHVAWELSRSQTLLVSTQAYLARHGTPQHPADLADHDCLAYLRDGGKPIWTFERQVRRQPKETVAVTVSGHFRANNSEVLRDVVLSGAGMALIPDFSAQQALAQGELVAVLPEWKSVGTFGERIFAIRPYSPQVPQAVQLMIEFLRANMAGAAPLNSR